MQSDGKRIVIVGGGTAGSVLAARLTEEPRLSVTVLEAGPDHGAYGDSVLEPALAAGNWAGVPPMVATPMATGGQPIPGLQGRILGGTSAVNGMATLRGLPADYDRWAAAGLDGWGWTDVLGTFIAAERDRDFPTSPLHGSTGPLPVRRWRRDELGHAPRAFLDGMIDIGERDVADVNDASQLPGVGVFPVTIDDDAKRVTTSLAYLTDEVRARDNLTIRTGATAAHVLIESGRVVGVTLVDGGEVAADEVVLAAGALWSPELLMRSGIGPADHLAEHGIETAADLPVGSTMSDHLGPGVFYQHAGPRGSDAGPAQVVLVGASDGAEVDYHAFPVCPPPSPDHTTFLMGVFLLRSSGRGEVRLGPEAGQPVVTAPPLPDDGRQRLRHAFDRLAAWERTAAFRQLGAHQVHPIDLAAADAVDQALDQLTISYGHMVGTCPMGTVVDADCLVRGVDGLRVVDGSVMPTIPSGNTYLGCVMVAERVAAKMRANG